jgi:fibronectin-binding autotransporter adhesin
MPDERTPSSNQRSSAVRALVARLAVVVAALIVLVPWDTRAQLTLNRFVDASNSVVGLDEDFVSTLSWTNNGFTNISAVSVNVVLSSQDPEGGDIFWVGETAAFLSYRIGQTGGVTNAIVYDFDPADFSESLNAIFPVTNAFTSPGANNVWDLLLANSDVNIGEPVFNYWRLIVTGDAKTNGTIEVGAQGIISGSDGYTVEAVISAGSGTGTNAVTAFVTNGQSLNFNGGISGTGELAKTGAGTLSLAGNSTNFSGTFSVGEGTANITTTTALGTGTVFQTNGSSTVIFSAGGNYTNNMTLANVSFTNSGNTLSGTITNSGSGTFLSAASTTNTISGVMTGSGGLTKDGDGVLVIAGSTNNTFTGATVVSDGSLVLSNSNGNAINDSSSITVNTGGTLVLGASNQIGDSVGLILNGGTLLVGAAGVSENLGTLTLTADSTIDFGNFESSLRELRFADSSGVTWATNTTLTITNWQGVAQTSSDFTRLFFGTDGLGLSEGQLGQIVFADQGIFGGTLLGTGELVPVPEPKIYVAALAICAAIGWRERKRLIALVRGKRV